MKELKRIFYTYIKIIIPFITVFVFFGILGIIYNNDTYGSLAVATISFLGIIITLTENRKQIIKESAKTEKRMKKQMEFVKKENKKKLEYSEKLELLNNISTDIGNIQDDDDAFLKDVSKEIKENVVRYNIFISEFETILYYIETNKTTFIMTFPKTYAKFLKIKKEFYVPFLYYMSNVFVFPDIIWGKLIHGFFNIKSQLQDELSGTTMIKVWDINKVFGNSDEKIEEKTKENNEYLDLPLWEGKLKDYLQNKDFHFNKIENEEYDQYKDQYIKSFEDFMNSLKDLSDILNKEIKEVWNELIN